MAEAAAGRGAPRQAGRGAPRQAERGAPGAGWAVEPGYEDAGRTWRDSPAATVAAFEALLAEGEEAARGRPLVVGPDATLPPGLLVLEDGSEVADSERPPRLPLGYHRLLGAGDGGGRAVVVAPGRCPAPPGRAWGVAVQVHAARSRASWGIGDLADVAEVGRWAREVGAGFLLLSPLHAPTPVSPVQPSPYYPGSRAFLNPLLLRPEDCPGADGLGDELEAAAAAGRALDADRRIDRDAVWALKRPALEAACRRSAGDPAFATWRAGAGPLLERFALFCALADEHGADWSRWPAALARGEEAALAAAAERLADRVRFHAWSQWCAAAQLAEAARVAPLVHDLAVGFDPGGADAWLWQDEVVGGVRLGAPPDEFNAAGQDWGLPPFHPARLAGAGYEPFLAMLRAGLRSAAGLRVDHVMGLFRQYWVPEGAGPEDGAYVRFPADDLLALLALEAQRAGAFVVGEDLGTVEDAVREALAERGVLSYRLLWFEDDPPPTWPVAAMAAVTTHDLPTVSGLWSGSDLDDQRHLGLEPNEESTRSIRERLRDQAGLEDGAPDAEAILAAHRLLATTAATLATVTLEDALGVRERPNHPGTVDEWPNWRVALPVPVEDFADHALAGRVAAAMSGHADAGRQATPAQAAEEGPAT